MALVTAIHLRGTRAAQPAASSANAGYIYCVTDEGNILERSSGSAWQAYSPTGSGTGTVTTTGSPASGELAQFSGATSITGVASPGNICEGRLTTETGVPVSTSDRTAQGTLYFTPSSPSGAAIGTGQISLYNGTRLVLKTFTELSLALTVTSGKNYDVFIDYNGGTPQIVLSAAWTNDTTRADALATQAGIIVKSGTAAYRWVGTIRASGANVTEDSGGITGTSQVGGKRFIWNAYNQVRRFMKVIDTTDTWSYTTNSFRQANGAAGNQVEYVTGNAASLLSATAYHGLNIASNGTYVSTGVGVDSTTVASGFFPAVYTSAANAFNAELVGYYTGYPGLGYHFLVWLERGAATGTSSFYGDNGGNAQSGLWAELWN